MCQINPQTHLESDAAQFRCSICNALSPIALRASMYIESSGKMEYKKMIACPKHILDMYNMVCQSNIISPNESMSFKIKTTVYGNDVDANDLLKVLTNLGVGYDDEPEKESENMLGFCELVDIVFGFMLVVKANCQIAFDYFRYSIIHGPCDIAGFHCHKLLKANIDHLWNPIIQ